ncbi:MAG TPA: hypothetical protein VHT29_11870 [Solirubrobacteraceae bacterium]|jgi:hypothetical protein|nr:hypothetical protein [Solirubrobacteraceae bacterium]
MFSSNRTSRLGQRALDALGLFRSFLLLEDDYDVDWEVDQEELTEVDHPHRAALRAGVIAERLAHRRPGQLAPATQLCLSPVSRPGGVRSRARKRHGDTARKGS